MMPDLPGMIVGMLSILALYFIYRHCDDLSDGNVGGDR